MIQHVTLTTESEKYRYLYC